MPHDISCRMQYECLDYRKTYNTSCVFVETWWHAYVLHVGLGCMNFVHMSLLLAYKKNFIDIKNIVIFGCKSIVRLQ
jgi:hypothetical protein